MVIITKSSFKYDPIEDGVYFVRVFGVKEAKKNEQHPEWTPSLSFTFQIIQEPHLFRRAWGTTPQRWFPGSKLDKWLTALGVDMNASEGSSLDVEALKNTHAKAFIETKDNSEYPNVTKLIPILQSDQATLSGLVVALQAKDDKRPKTSSTVAAKTVVAQPAPQVSQPAPQVSQPTAQVSQPTPQVVQPAQPIMPVNTPAPAAVTPVQPNEKVPGTQPVNTTDPNAVIRKPKTVPF